MSYESNNDGFTCSTHAQLYAKFNIKGYHVASCLGRVPETINS